MNSSLCPYQFLHICHAQSHSFYSVVVRRAGRSLDSGVRLKKKVPLARTCDNFHCHETCFKVAVQRLIPNHGILAWEMISHRAAITFKPGHLFLYGLALVEISRQYWIRMNPALTRRLITNAGTIWNTYSDKYAANLIRGFSEVPPARENV